MPAGVSKRFWDDAARDNAAWYIATGYTSESDEFFESGRREVDAFLALAEVSLGPDHTVVEIGCGAGRMTRRLAELAGTVIATDISAEMLVRAERNVAESSVEFVELSGAGDLPFADASASAVFSYITMQHVPTVVAQLAYVASSLRIVAPGGWVLMQFRRNGIVPRLLDWVGHVGHRLRGRRTLDRAWRGIRVPESRLLAFASDDVEVRLLRPTRRHTWMVARRRA